MQMGALCVQRESGVTYQLGVDRARCAIAAKMHSMCVVVCMNKETTSVTRWSSWPEWCRGADDPANFWEAADGHKSSDDTSVPKNEISKECEFLLLDLARQGEWVRGATSFLFRRRDYRVHTRPLAMASRWKNRIQIAPIQLVTGLPEHFRVTTCAERGPPGCHCHCHCHWEDGTADWWPRWVRKKRNKPTADFLAF